MKKLIAIALLAAPLPALGQLQPKQPTSVIKFDEGEKVDGTRSAPVGVLVTADDKNIKHDKIIQLRESFAERVLASSKELH